ncbi:MAG TPA: TIGR00303 family protein [Methanoregulaceae archaeon]|nr:TIGR00303 family protein [Methanoregulaceae archaeon]
MAFVTGSSEIRAKNPLFSSILANTMLSVVPGISGAGPSPEKTLLTPILDAELITCGKITSMPVRPDTPTGCPTPASITRAVMELCGLSPLFINGGLAHTPTVPCLDTYGIPGEDPRFRDAVPDAGALFRKGRSIGTFLGSVSDLLVLGECVPGGTTTSLCVLRGLGYDALVSSSYARNPVRMKEEVWSIVNRRIQEGLYRTPLDIVRCCGDPMIAIAAGIAATYSGSIILGGGTQMLSVAAVLKGMNLPAPGIATTCYVRDDASANFAEMAGMIGTPVYYVDPGFGELGHSGLARYCIGEVKEGMGAGGAMFLAWLMGHSPDAIRKKILHTVHGYA